MSDRLRTGRRRFLRLLGSLLLLLAGFPRALRAHRSPREEERSLVEDAASAATLGAAFLALRPEEGDRAALLRRLGLRADSPQRSHEQLARARARLGTRHRADFRRGRVVGLAGWTLSETELRLCALHALDPEARL